MMADLGRNMRDQIENDDDNDQVADSGTGETLAMEREFFAMAQDMNEVLISAVHDAAARDNIGVLQELLTETPELLNKLDNAKNAPVHWAAGNGSLKCLSFLLSLECDVTLKNALGDTPLHRAAWRNQTEAVKLLIDKGNIDLTIKNNAELLPIDLARDEEIQKLLKGLVPLTSVQQRMLVNEEDFIFESSEEESEENEFKDVIFEKTKENNDDDDNEDKPFPNSDDEDDEDDDVETIIIVSHDENDIFHSEIVAVGHRNGNQSVRERIRGPPPPVPPRNYPRSSLIKDVNEDRFIDVDDENEENNEIKENIEEKEENNSDND